jgi:transposase
VSTRVHSRYRRHLADLPVPGRPVTLWLTVRRFFCDHLDCSTLTFVEQVPGLTEHHARRSIGRKVPWSRSGWPWPDGLDHGWPPRWAWR